MMLGTSIGASMSNWSKVLINEDYNLDEVKRILPRGAYDFVSNNSKKLLVTIGDSWTYGDRLAEENPADKDFRLKHVYGYLICKELHTDFLNISVPGINNLWMVKKLELLCQNVEHYDQVNIIFMATEYGREFNTSFDLDPVYTQMYKGCATAKDVVVELENHVSDRIEMCRSDKIKIYTFTNYVTNLYKKSNPVNWLEILCNNKVEECYTIGSWVIPKFEALVDFNSDCNTTELKTELLTMMELAEKRFDIIYNTGYNHKNGYGHPNSKGHAKFADYFITQYGGKYA